MCSVDKFKPLFFKILIEGSVSIGFNLKTWIVQKEPFNFHPAKNFNLFTWQAAALLWKHGSCLAFWLRLVLTRCLWMPTMSGSILVSTFHLSTVTVVRQTSHITTHRNTSQQLSLGTQVPQDIDCGDGTEIKLRFNYFSDVIQVFFFLDFTLTLVVCRKINYII